MQALLVARMVHLYGFAMWIGSLFGTVAIMQFHDEEKAADFKTRVARLARGGMIAADIGATLTIAAGIYMATTVGHWGQPWLHIKLTLVALVLAIHVYLRIFVKRRTQADVPPAKVLRVLRPVLSVLIAGVLYLVIFRPLGR